MNSELSVGVQMNRERVEDEHHAIEEEIIHGNEKNYPFFAKNSQIFFALLAKSLE